MARLAADTLAWRKLALKAYPSLSSVALGHVLGKVRPFDVFGTPARLLEAVASCHLGSGVLRLAPPWSGWDGFNPTHRITPFGPFQG